MRQTLDKARIKELVRGRWTGVLASLGIAVPNNNKRRVPCPVSGGTDRFQFDDQNGDGTWFCRQCIPHAGDGFALIQKVKRCTFLEALRLVSETLCSPDVQLAPPILPRPKVSDNEFSARLAMRLWNEAQEDTGRIRAYLVSRGLPGHVPDALRYHANLSYREINPDGSHVETFHPGIVAQIMRGTVPIPAVHRIYLDRDGDGKASVEMPKKALGSIAGGAIHLAPYQPDRPLILCEGAETGIAVQGSTGWQTWACISARGLEAAHLPDDCGPIYIAADLDRNGCGEIAANKLAVRLLREGRTVSVLFPPGPIPEGSKGVDWLDVLTGAYYMEGVGCL